jgi:hypothetical protein
VSSPTPSVGAPSWLFTARRPEGAFPVRGGEAVLLAPTQLCSLPEGPVTTWSLELRALDRDGAFRPSTALATFGWPSGQPVLFEVRAETLVVRAVDARSADARRLDAHRLDVRGRLRLPRWWRRLHLPAANAAVAVVGAGEGPVAVMTIWPAWRAAAQLALADVEDRS